GVRAAAVLGASSWRNGRRRRPLTMQSPITGPFAPSVVRLGVPLLDWQLWCLGRDILAPGGNLLGRAGFVRHRPEALVPGARPTSGTLAGASD
ncbi:MAG: hypothetical protein ACK6AH_01965, partial [Gemmatimonadota bacterium]